MIYIILILIILIPIAFGIGYVRGKKKVFVALETKADEDTTKKVADILKKNKELMEKIRNR